MTQRPFGYGQAAVRIIGLLNDSDWRVVYASARALGWLGAVEAIPTLEQVATTHWLPDIRSFALEVISALRSQGRSLPKLPRGERTNPFRVHDPAADLFLEEFTIEPNALSVVGL